MSELYRSGRYGQLNPGWHAEDADHKAFQLAAAMRFSALHPQTVVDVGCGTGAVLRRLKALRDADGHTACAYEGWDIAPDAVRTARQYEGDRLLFVAEDFLRAARRRASRAVLPTIPSRIQAAGTSTGRPSLGDLRSIQNICRT